MKIYLNVVLLEEACKESYEKIAAELEREGIKVEVDKPLKLSSFREWENSLDIKLERGTSILNIVYLKDTSAVK